MWVRETTLSIRFNLWSCRYFSLCYPPPSFFMHFNASKVSWRSVWLSMDEAVTPDVYRSSGLCWIYFYKSIQICFCAADRTGGVNALYKVFRSGIRFSPNSISQFCVFSRAFIILTVADKAIIFPEQLQNVDKCSCDSVSVWGGVGWGGGRDTNIIPTVIDDTYCSQQRDILCNTMETVVMSIYVLMRFLLHSHIVQ